MFFYLLLTAPITDYHSHSIRKHHLLKRTASLGAFNVILAVQLLNAWAARSPCRRMWLSLPLAGNGMMSASTATSVAMASVPTVDSSCGKENPSGLPKAESLEVRFSWPFARTASPSGLSRLHLGADCSGWLRPEQLLAF